MRRASALGVLLAAVSVFAVSHGKAVAPGKFPEVVALVDRGTPGAGVLGSKLEGVFCTGVLVRPTVVVTAAHCVIDWDTNAPRANLTRQVSIYVGPGRLNSRGAVAGQARITRVEVAAGYPDNQLDLALLELAAPLEKVAPATLLASALPPAPRLESVGFGELNPGGKANTMGQKSAATRVAEVVIGPRFCSVRRNVSTPSSGGDSGGPAFLATDAGPRVAGIMSGFVAQSIDGGAEPEELDCWVDVSTVERWVDAFTAHTP